MRLEERELVVGFARSILGEISLALYNRRIRRELGPEEADILRKAADVRVKASIMRDLIAHEKEDDRLDNGVEQSRLPEITEAAQRIGDRFVGSSSIQNIDFIQQVIHKAQNEGQKVIITPRHESDFDPVALRNILLEAQLEDFWNNITWIAGVNMLKRPFIRPWTRLAHAIYIATPADRQMLEDLAGYFPEDEFCEIKKTFTTINVIAGEKTKKAIERGEMIGVFPEAGRSQDGLMRKAPSEVAHYFPRNEGTLVLPYRLIGPREVNPPNRLVALHKLIPPFRQHLIMIAGQPYSSSEVWQWRSRDRLERVRQNPADWVMANIANLDWRDVRPVELAAYREMLVRFRPERNRIPDLAV